MGDKSLKLKLLEDSKKIFFSRNYHHTCNPKSNKDTKNKNKNTDIVYIDLIDFICKAPEAFPYCRNFHLCIVNVYVLCFNMEWSYFITQLFLHCRLYNIHKIRSQKTNKWKDFYKAQNAYNACKKMSKGKQWILGGEGCRGGSRRKERMMGRQPVLKCLTS